MFLPALPPGVHLAKGPSSGIFLIVFGGKFGKADETSFAFTKTLGAGDDEASDAPGGRPLTCRGIGRKR